MFAQFIITTTGILLFVWLAWKWVVVPILKEKGIEYDEPKTDQTEKLKRLQDQFKKMDVSAQAAEEGVEVLKQIKALERKIEEADERMRDIDD